MPDPSNDNDPLAAVNAAFHEYISAVAKSFSVKRSLADGTPVTELSEAEYRLLTDFLRGAVEPKNRQVFREYYEIPAGANAYVVAFLGWFGYIGTLAAGKGRQPIFAAPATARAHLNYISLSILNPMQFIDWGDIAKIYKAKPELLDDAFIIGDLDSHPDPGQRCSLSSGDGMISHEQTLAAITALAQEGRTQMVLFHRADAVSPFNVAELAAALSRPASVTPRAAAKKSGCFVATACYGAPDHPTVLRLRAFRDQRLTPRWWGRTFIRFYAFASPPVAAWLERHPRMRVFVRDCVLAPLARALSF